MADKPELIPHRRKQSTAAVVMIHGFGGDAATTWGNFPTLLKDEPSLNNWDVYSIGYSTSLSFDLAGIWSADPALVTLGGLLNAVTDVPPLGGYKALAMMAHSMGGLLLQKALLTNPALRQRVSHVLLFGTPSAGLEKASPFQFWKRQVRDMAKGSDFITGLRAQWNTDVGAKPPFKFIAIGGDRDEFVPRSSSIEPFPESQQCVVYGNPLEIVKPPDAKHLGYKVAVQTVSGLVESGDGPTADFLDSALRAVESRQFRRAIDTMWPHRDELDDQGLVSLALALESDGRQADAIELLTSMKDRLGTDPLGVLAGRLKRRWLVEHRRADAERAIALYLEGLIKAEAKPDAGQAFYHAINCAFMDLAYGSDVTSARDFAVKALRYAGESGHQDVWRYATEGEAHLYLGDSEAALAAYARAVALVKQPRQAASMYQQAIRAADLMGEEELTHKLPGLFGQPATT
ncbi:MAG TPA: tetratricopeptide repeat-containing protein [Vicinamibacterales bacterium]|nr:tetratricopeptide repeat-containing protein [Vicinamibacterales bacterium]